MVIGSATTGGLGAALDGQTANLDTANDRTLGSIEITERCEAEQAEAIAKITKKPWYRRIF